MDGESHKLAILEQACKVTDRIAELDTAMDGQPFTVLGSAGQVTIHPLIAEVRSQQGLRASLLKLWAFLRVTTRKPNKPRLRLEPTRPARPLTPDGTSEGTPNRHDAHEKPLPSQDRGHGSTDDHGRCAPGAVEAESA